MEIKKIKVQDVLTCSEEDSLKVISEKLKENKDRRIFVISSDNELKGIITTTDLVYKALCSEDCGNNLKAKDIMTTDVRSVDINEDINKALEIMDDLKTFVCPLTEDKKLLGLVEYNDIVEHVLESIKEN